MEQDREKEIEGMLDTLARYIDLAEQTELQKRELIESILPPEIREAIDDVEVEFDEKLAAVHAEIESLSSAIKQAVLEHGKTVEGNYLRAVWSKGRGKWNTAGLQGYAKARPEILDFYQEGKPSVSIRTV